MLIFDRFWEDLIDLVHTQKMPGLHQLLPSDEVSLRERPTLFRSLNSKWAAEEIELHSNLSHSTEHEGWWWGYDLGLWAGDDEEVRKWGEIELHWDLFISQRAGNGNAKSDDATASAPELPSATTSKESDKSIPLGHFFFTSSGVVSKYSYPEDNTCWTNLTTVVKNTFQANNFLLSVWISRIKWNEMGISEINSTLSWQWH